MVEPPKSVFTPSIHLSGGNHDWSESSGAHDTYSTKCASGVSRVLFVTVADQPWELSTGELYQIFSRHQGLERIVILRKVPYLQALVHYSNIDSTIAAKVSFDGKYIYDNCFQLIVEFSNYFLVPKDRGKQMTHTSFGNPPLCRDIYTEHLMSSTKGNGEEFETMSIVLVSIHNQLYPITVDILHQVFSVHGEVLAIEIVEEHPTLQARVTYYYAQNAVAAKNLLDGRNIYDGCCALEVEILYEKIQHKSFQLKEKGADAVLGFEGVEVNATTPINSEEQWEDPWRDRETHFTKSTHQPNSQLQGTHSFPDFVCTGGDICIYGTPDIFVPNECSRSLLSGSTLELLNVILADKDNAKGRRTSWPSYVHLLRLMHKIGDSKLPCWRDTSTCHGVEAEQWWHAFEFMSSTTASVELPSTFLLLLLYCENMVLGGVAYSRYFGKSGITCVDLTHVLFIRVTFESDYIEASMHQVTESQQAIYSWLPLPSNYECVTYRGATTQAVLDPRALRDWLMVDDPFSVLVNTTDQMSWAVLLHYWGIMELSPSNIYTFTPETRCTACSNIMEGGMQPNGLFTRYYAENSYDCSVFRVFSTQAANKDVRSFLKNGRVGQPVGALVLSFICKNRFLLSGTAPMMKLKIHLHEMVKHYDFDFDEHNIVEVYVG